MERPIRLHLGAGDKYWPGFINCDLHGNQDYNCFLPEIDRADEIHAIHLFEHLSRLEVPTVLSNWRDALVDNGLLVLEMPSMDKIAKLITEGVTNQRLTLLGIFGDPRDPKPDMMHQWCYTNRELEQILTQAGFHEIQFMEPIYHIAQRDLRVECRRKT